MPCSLMGPVTLWESNGSGRLLYGVLYDDLQKLLKERLNWDSLQKCSPCTSTLTLEWWQMACGDGYSNGSRTAGSTEEISWIAALWKGIPGQIENLIVKVCHVVAHIPKSCVTEEPQNNQQVKGC